MSIFVVVVGKNMTAFMLQLFSQRGQKRAWLFPLWSPCYFHPLNPPKGQSLRLDSGEPPVSAAR